MIGVTLMTVWVVLIDVLLIIGRDHFLTRMLNNAASCEVVRIV